MCGPWFCRNGRFRRIVYKSTLTHPYTIQQTIQVELTQRLHFNTRYNGTKPQYSQLQFTRGTSQNMLNLRQERRDPILNRTGSKLCDPINDKTIIPQINSIMKARLAGISFSTHKYYLYIFSCQSSLSLEHISLAAANTITCMVAYAVNTFIRIMQEIVLKLITKTT